MTHLATGAHAALAVIGFLLALLGALVVPVVVLGAVGWWAWNGPAARAGMRVRAWRFVRRLRS